MSPLRVGEVARRHRRARIVRGRLVRCDVVRVPRQVAHALKDSLVRPADLAARYGGEEFVALLPDTDPAGARMVAERIRQAVMALGIPHACNGAGVVTISAGVYTSGAGGGMATDSATALVERTDALLCRAKQSGRNQVWGGDIAAP